MMPIEGSQNQNLFPIPDSIRKEIEPYVGKHVKPETDFSPSPEELTQPIDEARFTMRAVGEYLNPVKATRAYGRFVKRTVKKFGLAELNGTATALGGAYLANKYGGDFASPGALAAAGTVGESVGFYGTVISRRYRELRKDKDVHYSRREAAAETLRYLYTGFSVAEFIDNPARVGIMWGAGEVNQDAGMVVDPVIAVGIGKILSDHVYYGAVDPAVKIYHKRHEARKHKKLQNSPKS